MLDGDYDAKAGNSNISLYTRRTLPDEHPSSQHTSTWRLMFRCVWLDK